jgi:hypothetical protein
MSDSSDEGGDKSMDFDGGSDDDGDIGEISDEQIEALKKNVSWEE